MGAFGAQNRLRGKMGPETSNISLATGYLERGGAKGRFCAKSHIFTKKPKMVELHDIHVNVWNLAKGVIFHENWIFRKSAISHDAIPGVTDNGDGRFAGSVQHRRTRTGGRPLRNEVPFGGGCALPPHSNT